MKNLIFIMLISVLLSFASYAQTNQPTGKTSNTQTASEEKPKKQIFRAGKNQVIEAQNMLKTKNYYSGEADGKFSDDFRAAIKKYQSENGLKATGTLNRATLEKMGVKLTDKQKEIPASPNSYAANETKTSDGSKSKKMIFRATKEQIMTAQKKLKENKFYDGAETGKLDEATRDGLKKYQEANGIKATGTLNQVTLEKMGIELTDKQKENAKSESR